jgi:hypothetical protein
MNMGKTCRAAIAAGVFGATVIPAGPAHALQLITEKEAALPPVPIVHERGISRGPTIMVVSPAPNAGMIQSPFTLKIMFESHGSATVNVESVLVTYMKEPTIDLTQRIKPFIGASGIDVKRCPSAPGYAHFARRCHRQPGSHDFGRPHVQSVAIAAASDAENLPFVSQVRFPRSCWQDL